MAHPPDRRARSVVSVLALGVALSSPARAEWPHDHRTPLTLRDNTGALTQFVDAAIADGSGGAYVFVLDDRNSNRDIFAFHLRGDGTMDPEWDTFGLPIAISSGEHGSVRALDDLAGGIWVAWVETIAGVPRVFATRVLKTGAVDPGFPPNGLALDAVRPNGQHDLSVCPGPAGTLVAVWEYDFSPTDHDIYGAEVNAAGTLLWSKGLYAGTAMDAKPDISPEPGVFSLVWVQGAACVYARQAFGSGNPFGSPQTIVATTEPETAPKVCPDGWGGTYVACATKPGGSSAIVARRIYGGAPALDYGQFGALQATPWQIRLAHAGSFQAWLAFSHDGTNSVATASLNRDGHGPVLTLPPIIATPQTQLVGDGSGGALFAVQYFEPGGNPIRAIRYNSSNTVPAGVWFGAPQPVMQLARHANPTAICGDGNGGVIVFGVDPLFIPTFARAIRVDRWGALDGAPSIQSVQDVANDQGGHVRVAWKASYLDRETDPWVDHYRLWRQVPVASLSALRRSSARAFDEGANDELAPGSLRLQATATATFAWELVTTQIANAFPSYSLTVATVSDSAAGGPANTVYMVEARYSGGGAGWASPPDSGHSVDNLAPATPSPFTGTVVGGANTQLTWGANSESDLAGYELHRGASAGFVPGPGNLVASTTGTQFLDSGEVGDYYKLAAFDTHGNRSGYALVTPGGTLDTPGDRLPAALALEVASPNPARARATFRYALPVAGPARLQLYDVHGRLVREWTPGAQGPGEYVEPWDGRERSGTPAASGVYFVRLSFAGRQLVRRLVLAH